MRILVLFSKVANIVPIGGFYVLFENLNEMWKLKAKIFLLVVTVKFIGPRVQIEV